MMFNVKQIQTLFFRIPVRFAFVVVCIVALNIQSIHAQNQKTKTQENVRPPILFPDGERSSNVPPSRQRTTDLNERIEKENFLNSATLEDLKTVTDGIDSPKVQKIHKVSLVQLLGRLAGLLPKQKEVTPDQVRNPLLQVLRTENYLNDPSFTYVMKESAIISLTDMRGEDGWQQIVSLLGATLQNPKEHPMVRESAATALARFNEESEPATDQLIRHLEDELKLGPNATNGRIVQATVHSLGKLQNRKAVQPLLHLINSTFPDPIKLSAQKALDNIRWN